MYVCFFSFICSRGCTRRNLYFHVESQHSERKRLTGSIDLRSRDRINPRSTRLVSGKANECRWRPRSYHVDAWSTRGEVARGILRSSPKPDKNVPGIFLAIGEVSIILSSVFYTPVAKCFVSEAWPAPAMYNRLWCEHCCVTRGWVGAPNGRAPCRIHDAVVGSVDPCLSRIRNLAASN